MKIFLPWFDAFFSGNRWYRKLRGGKWYLLRNKYGERRLWYVFVEDGQDEIDNNFIWIETEEYGN